MFEEIAFRPKPTQDLTVLKEYLNKIFYLTRAKQQISKRCILRDSRRNSELRVPSSMCHIAGPQLTVGTNALLMWSNETFLTVLSVLNKELGTRKLENKEEMKPTLLSSELENLGKGKEETMPGCNSEYEIQNPNPKHIK